MKDVKINNSYKNKFLHGYCDIFVVALFNFAKKHNLNYKICWLGEDYATIHCFAIFTIKKTKYYIDIRGITDSIDNFFKEFETRFDYKSYFNGNKKSFEIYEFECVDDYFEFTQIDTFKNFKDFYNQSYQILENYSSYYLISEKME